LKYINIILEPIIEITTVITVTTVVYLSSLPDLVQIMNWACLLNS